MSVFDSIIDWKKRNKLEQLARQEFEQARGTAHAKMLSSSHAQIMNKITKTDQQVSNLENKWRNAYSHYQHNLRRALEEHIVTTRLTEIPGIGPKLQQMIMSQIFRGSLKDLYYAHQLPGVGQSKQFQINAWINKYESLIPKLLEGDFPGKEQFKISTNKEIDTIKKNIEKLRTEKNKLEKKAKTAVDTLNGLCVVNLDDFIHAYLNPNENNPLINHYLQGVFAEWEPMPKWFKEIIEEG